jgi:predicted dehydrogenase
MTSGRPLSIGLIGASRVAAYAIIAPARHLEGVNVVALAARDPMRAKPYAEQFGIERVHGSYAELFEDPQVDLIYLGTPPAFHREQALAAIAAGKSVLVEKPFALTSADALMVYEAAAAAGVHVFEAMHSVHHCLFARILDLARGGEIGVLQSIQASFAAPVPEHDLIRWRPELGGGALMDLGVYPLAWVRRIAGEEFAVVSCDAVIKHGVDASFNARLEFANGVACEIFSSMTEPSASARLVLNGELGTVSVCNPLDPQTGHSLTLRNSTGERVETVDGPSTYWAQLAAVAATLRRGEAFPLPADDYVWSMRAIERMRAAMSGPHYLP